MDADRRSSLRGRFARPRTVGALLAAIMAIAAAPAGAQAPRTLALTTTAGADMDVDSRRVSADGTRVYFQTPEAIPGTGDTDTTSDLYERRIGGGLRLLSTSGAPLVPDFAAASADGSHVLFETAEAIPGTGDTDTAPDVYERRSDGSLRLITPGTSNAPAGYSAISQDATRVVFQTPEALAGTGDTDISADVYERRADGGLRLLSNGGANYDANFAGASQDGSRVFFVTAEALPGTGDTDTALDAYERRADGGLRLVSTAGANVNVSFRGASADGTRAFFQTTEALPGTGDTDAGADVYERRADGGLRLLSAGSSADGANFNATSADGSRVYFSTAEALLDDTDDGLDIYERREDGGLRLISTSGTGSTVFFAGASADGSRVRFETAEPVPGTGDTDTAADVYERGPDDRVRLLSTAGANVEASFDGASIDGARVFFRTSEALPGTGDTDTALDVYERGFEGGLRLISTGGANTNAFLAGASGDGSRVFFVTTEAIPGTGDTDTGGDIYERAWSVPAFDGPAAIGGVPVVGGTLRCIAAAVTGEGFVVSFAWLRDGALIPGASGPEYIATSEDRGRSLACRATATNPIGDGSRTSPSAVVAAAAVPPALRPPDATDRRAPTARIAVPRCATRLSRTACRRFRASPRAWRTLRGTVSDPAPSSGIARVELTIVRRTGRRCAAYDGRRFVSMPCASAGRRTVAARVRGRAWALRLLTLPRGRYVVTARAVDRAANRQGRPAARSLDLR